MDIFEDFVSKEARRFKFKIGSHLASSLSGFVTGAIAASIVWITAIWATQLLSLF